MGARIMIAGPASRNIPTPNSSRLIRKSKISGLSESPRIHAARISGAWDRLVTVLKAIAAPTSKSTTEDTIAASVNTFGKSRTVIDLRMKRLTINAYATATADASVGVKIPPSIPPRMIRGVNSGKNALIDAFPRSDQVARFVATGKS